MGDSDTNPNPNRNHDLKAGMLLEWEEALNELHLNNAKEKVMTLASHDKATKELNGALESAKLQEDLLKRGYELRIENLEARYAALQLEDDLHRRLIAMKILRSSECNQIHLSIKSKLAIWRQRTVVESQSREQETTMARLLDEKENALIKEVKVHSTIASELSEELLAVKADLFTQKEAHIVGLKEATEEGERLKKDHEATLASLEADVVNERKRLVAEHGDALVILENALKGESEQEKQACNEMMSEMKEKHDEERMRILKISDQYLEENQDLQTALSASIEETHTVKQHNTKRHKELESRCSNLAFAANSVMQKGKEMRLSFMLLGSTLREILQGQFEKKIIGLVKSWYVNVFEEAQRALTLTLTLIGGMSMSLRRHREWCI